MTDTDSEVLGSVRSSNSELLLLSVLLAAALVIASLFSQNTQTTVYYIVFGAAIGVLALIGRGRIKAAGDLQRVGTVGVQHSWITGSLGLAFLSLVPSSFFAAPAWVKTVAAVAGAVWTLIGLYGLRENTSKAKVPLSI